MVIVRKGHMNLYLTSNNAPALCKSISLEIALSLAQHEGFCPVGVLFHRGHPIQRHLESALLVDV